MKVGIIGSGGREHAICQSLKISNKFTEIFCFPGNAGTARLANNVELDLNNFETIKNYIFKKKNRFNYYRTRKTISRWFG